MCFLLLHQTTLPMPDSSLSGNTLGITIQIIGALIFLVAGAYAYRCLKTKSIGFKQTKKSLRKLQILETKPLGNRQYLLVLSYEQEKILMGIHANGMQFLCKLKDTLPPSKES